MFRKFVIDKNFGGLICRLITQLIFVNFAAYCKHKHQLRTLFVCVIRKAIDFESLKAASTIDEVSAADVT